MTRLLASVCLAALIALPASAALKNGVSAPEFKAQASMAGKQFEFDLGAAIKKGPVVLYFYPAAFTPGCTIEAHMFADAMEDFEKLGATVIGVSRDDIKTLDRFSLTECRSKFPVAADGSGRITRSYDAAMRGVPEYADRISYVLADGKVIYNYTSGDPTHHVENTMNAIKQYKTAQK
jgi:thioredoxin-dependent peroxiredoxin